MSKESKPQVELIKWSYPVLTVILVILTLFGISVGLKYHGSSMTLWNQFTHQESEFTQGYIAGTPKAIRADEWIVLTPLLLSQVKQDFPLHNPNIGYDSSTLCMNVPTRHIASLARPQFWGFFLLPLENAYSLYWNIKVFGVLLSSFLFFLFLTRNRFWISLTGSFILFACNYTQWWFSTYISELIMCFSLIMLGAFYFTYGQKLKEILFGWFLFLYFSLSFMTIFYPPFQIQLAYIGVFLYLGHVFTFFPSISELRKSWQFRTILLALFCIISGAFAYKYLMDMKPLIERVMVSEYPGKRIVYGGQGSFFRLITGYWAIFHTEQSFPPFCGNVCEAANGMFFSIFLLPLLVRFRSRLKIFWPLLLSLGIYAVVLLFWYFTGLPQIIAKIFMLNRIPETRLFFGFAFLDFLFLLIFARIVDGEKLKRTLSSNLMAGEYIQLAAIVLFGLGLFYKDRFFNGLQWYQVGITAISIGLMLTLFYLQRAKLAMFGMCALLAVNLHVNPISKGLTPIYGSGLAEFVEKMPDNDGKRFWIAEQHHMANLLRAFGEDVMNGTSYSPNLEYFAPIDPGLQNFPVYNRYGHGSIHLFYDYYGYTTRKFKLYSPDSFGMTLSPYEPGFEELGVTHILTAYPRGYPCYELIYSAPYENFFVYKYHTPTPPEEYRKMEIMSDVEIQLETVEGKRYDGVGSRLFVVHKNDPLRIQGWAVTKKLKEPVHSLALFVNGTKLFARTGHVREDVVRYTGDKKSLKSGYSFIIPPELLNIGDNTLFLAVEKDPGKWYKTDYPPLFLYK